MISGQKVGNLRLISGGNLFLEITMILVQKVGIPRLFFFLFF